MLYYLWMLCLRFFVDSGGKTIIIYKGPIKYSVPTGE